MPTPPALASDAADATDRTKGTAGRASGLVFEYFGTLVGTEYEIALWLEPIRRLGVTVEVRGGLAQRRPTPLVVYDFIPVRLELPDVTRAWMAAPYPFTGVIRVELLADGATVRAAADAIGLTLFGGLEQRLFRFDAVAGVAR